MIDESYKGHDWTLRLMKYANDNFVQLHNHTSYSMLDGASKIPELVEAAARLEMPGLATTDHGNLHALPEFYRECKSADINPILGCEVYFTEDSSVRGPTETGKQAYHLILIAVDNQGYQNLMKLSSMAYLEGMWHKARTDWAMLEKHSEGLIATTGCLGGIVLQKIMAGDVAGAERDAARLQDIFGKGNLDFELQSHGLQEQVETNPILIEMAKRLGAPVISTNDTHYVNHDDHVAHDSLLCLQTGSKIADTDRFKFGSDQHHLKSAAEMRALFPMIPEAANNTLEINQRANVTLDFDTLHLPNVDVPSNVPVHEGVSPEGSWLALLAHSGLQKRYGVEAQLHETRLQYELSSVESLGLSAYFLIVWDIVRFTDQNNIARGPGRGSAAGSIISYCMNITKVDPMRHGLMFERFLNPSRIAMPDIDLDFSPRDRDKIINYITEKYGQEQVSQIVTFSTIKARSAVRDSARVLGFPPKLGDDMAKLMPAPVSGFDAALQDCVTEKPGAESIFRNAEDLRAFIKRNGDAQKVMDVALGLEGLVRQTGTGAAGVLITPGPVTDYVPVQTQGTGDAKHVVTQYDKNICEDLGLVKMDILGLRNLDVIQDTLASIDDDIDFYAEDMLRFDNLPTFDLLRKGDTIGVFQLESPPMQDLLRAISPNTIDDIAAVVALYRPGPMGTNMHYDYANRKNGRQQVELFHDDAGEILQDTYGLMIYQEQSMKLAQKFCGYTGADADNLRKIIGKKLVDKMRLEKQKMIDGAEANGYGKELGEHLYEMTESSALYSFNEAHAVSYAYISYQTAFLKANYPVAYMAALADSFSDDLGRCAAILAEARRMGIQIAPANVRQASGAFIPSGNSIMVGMNAIKYVGSDTVQEIVEWQTSGADDSLGSLLSEVSMNLREMNALASAGALDTYGSRRGLMLSAEELLSESRRRQKENSSKQNALFDTIDYWDIDIPDIQFTELERLQAEKDVLGLYVSGNPVSQFSDYKTDDTLQAAVSSPTERNKSREVLCVIMKIVTKKTRAGGEMATVTVGDEGFTADITIFPRSWAEFGKLLVEDTVGIMDIATKEDSLTGGLQPVGRLWIPVKESVEVRRTDFDAVCFRVPRGMGSNDSAVSKLKGVLASYPGDYPVDVQVSEKTSLDMRVDLRVHPTKELFMAVSEVFNRYSADRKVK